jgi:hypothetical protein
MERRAFLRLTITASSRATLRTPTAVRLPPRTETRAPSERVRTDVRLERLTGALRFLAHLRPLTRRRSAGRRPPPWGTPGRRRSAVITIGGTTTLLRAGGCARLRPGLLRLRELDAISARFGRAGSSESDHRGGWSHLFLLINASPTPRRANPPEAARFPCVTETFLDEQTFSLRGVAANDLESFRLLAAGAFGDRQIRFDSHKEAGNQSRLLASSRVDAQSELS